MRYVTRKRPQVDRCASAWLLKRFVDADAKFGFVEEGQPVGEAIPFDMSGVELGHQRGRCSFEAILAAHQLTEPALVELGRIIRSADLLDAEETLEGPGLDLLFRGLIHLTKDDQEVLRLAEPILDALYAALQDREKGRAARPRARRRTSAPRRSERGS
ncbi:MAG TPA: chromate resistance protein ChrB domain-containing protein [Candidatus Methylomirabilis sp.]|nr:chromate resistance protein ChrB domain-containing protein [Candidatus Methylomirabilis sp.]